MPSEQLALAEIPWVSKAAEALSDAAASVCVVSHDVVTRSGTTILPERLRLTPGLDVRRTSTANRVVTAHGFTGNSAGQNFPGAVVRAEARGLDFP